MMISSIRPQNVAPSHQSIAGKNREEATSKTSFSKTFSKVTGSREKKSQRDTSVHSETGGLTRSDMMNIIQAKISELQDRLENGETEPTYQIGGKAFTKKEWDNLIFKVDRALEKDEQKDADESEEKKDNAIKPNDQEKIV